MDSEEVKSYRQKRSAKLARTFVEHMLGNVIEKFNLESAENPKRHETLPVNCSEVTSTNKRPGKPNNVNDNASVTSTTSTRICSDLLLEDVGVEEEPEEDVLEDQESTSSSFKPYKRVFVAHPVSFGVDYHLHSSAWRFKSEQRKLEKKNRRFGGTLRYPFFPNVVKDSSQTRKIPPDQSMNSEVTSSNIPMTPERDSGAETLSTQFILKNFFNGVCPKTFSSHCSNKNCSSKQHELPNVDYLAQQLLLNSSNVVKEVYDFITASKDRFLTYFPAFAKFYARQKDLAMLKTLLSDGRNFPSCLEFTVDALVRNGFTEYDAVKFIAENHDGTSQASNEIITRMIYAITRNNEEAETQFKFYFDKIN